MATIIGTLARAGAIIGTAFFTFVIGNFMWAALSGFVAGFFDIFGITLGAPFLLAFGPLFGGALAIGAVMVVFD